MLATVRTELIKVLPTILPRNPLRRIASGLAADLHKGFAVEFRHVGPGGGDGDVVGAVAEFFDGFVRVRGARHAARGVFHPVRCCAAG